MLALVMGHARASPALALFRKKKQKADTVDEYSSRLVKAILAHHGQSGLQWGSGPGHWAGAAGTACIILPCTTPLHSKFWRMTAPGQALTHGIEEQWA